MLEDVVVHEIGDLTDHWDFEDDLVADSSSTEDVGGTSPKEVSRRNEDLIQGIVRSRILDKEDLIRKNRDVP